MSMETYKLTDKQIKYIRSFLRTDVKYIPSKLGIDHVLSHKFKTYDGELHSREVVINWLEIILDNEYYMEGDRYMLNHIKVYREELNRRYGKEI